jgi:hypothetical protein
MPGESAQRSDKHHGRVPPDVTRSDTARDAPAPRDPSLLVDHVSRWGSAGLAGQPVRGHYAKPADRSVVERLFVERSLEFRWNRPRYSRLAVAT